MLTELQLQNILVYLESCSESRYKILSLLFIYLLHHLSGHMLIILCIYQLKPEYFAAKILTMVIFSYFSIGAPFLVLIKKRKNNFHTVHSVKVPILNVWVHVIEIIISCDNIYYYITGHNVEILL